jgi:hypothetical protein
MSNARFAIIQAVAVKDPRVSDSQFRTLAALGMYADEQGWCYPSLKTLGKDLQKSFQAVGKDTVVLRKLGYLEVRARAKKDGSRNSNLYRLRFDLEPLQPVIESGIQRGDEGGIQRGVEYPSTSEVEYPSTSEVERTTHLTTQLTYPEKTQKKAKTKEPESHQNLVDSANRLVDGILESERGARSKGWSTLPEIFHPLARAFCETTTLSYSKKFASDWMATFSDWLNEGYSPEMISQAIREICGDPRPTAITRPGSIDWKLRDMKVKRALTAANDPYAGWKNYSTSEPEPELVAVNPLSYAEWKARKAAVPA